MDYEYTRSTTKSIPDAIAALETALASRKFAALWHLNMQAKLEEKGFPGAPELHIFEVCNAGRAKEALEANIMVGYFLPCKMTVYAKDGETRIGLLRPHLLMDLLGESKLKGLATDVEDVLKAAVDEAAGGGQ